ncbi:hypothetical protein DYB32_001333 [Aphanomyces invadans]|uniref:RRM domain-containing protein n=1 Tax=Aphanomyces invadans TaxID=157072 RepID=A0A3R6YFT0_9STRA|nr:hypothetical protein DYB32_001333 [Aphanomyces invadans]
MAPTIYLPMAAMEPKLNAKERRKLRRAAAAPTSEPVDKKDEISAAPSKKDEDVNQPPMKKGNTEDPQAMAQRSTPTPVHVVQSIKDDVKAKAKPAEEDFIQLPSLNSTPTVEPENTTAANAKARRLAARAAKRERPSSDEPTEEKPQGSEASNAKARRLEKRAASRMSTATDATSSATTAKKVPKRKLKDPNAKSIHLTLFLGQLPFDATEEMIRKHFHEAGDIKIRMLTDKATKKFKGTAFIEVKDSAALGAALSRHHSLLNNRRINVELTANGGGTKSELRQTRIKDLRDKQKVKQVEKVQALLQKHVDDPECKLTQEDVDERMTDFLSWFDYETAKLALEEFNRCVGERVM